MHTTLYFYLCLQFLQTAACLLPICIGSNGIANLAVFTVNQNYCVRCYEAAVLGCKISWPPGAIVCSERHRYETMNMWNDITCTINCNYRIAATLRIYPRTTVCFRCIVVNTLHKCENNNNNNKYRALFIFSTLRQKSYGLWSLVFS